MLSNTSFHTVASARAAQTSFLTPYNGPVDFLVPTAGVELVEYISINAALTWVSVALGLLHRAVTMVFLGIRSIVTP